MAYDDEISVTFTRSEWLDIVMAIWAKRETIRERDDIDDDIKDFWCNELRKIQEKIRQETYEPEQVETVR